MPNKKKAIIPKKESINSKKIRVPVKKEKKRISREENPLAFATITPSELWNYFDDAFNAFRNDFEELLFPSPWSSMFPVVSQTRTPLVDLEDQGKNFLLKAEMPGFKKEDIEISVQEDLISVSAEVGWSYDKKEQEYICKERECRSFYRTIQLPEEVNVEDVSAELSDGILEVNLPKKTPKKKKKVAIK